MQVLAASRYDYHPTIMGQFPLDRHLPCVLDNSKGQTTNNKQHEAMCLRLYIEQDHYILEKSVVVGKSNLVGQVNGLDNPPSPWAAISPTPPC